MTIGDKIKQYRLNKSLSLQNLATLAGLSKATIQQYEDGAIKPSNKALIGVAQALNINIWNLFPNSDNELEIAEFRHGEKLEDADLEKKKIYGLVIDQSERYVEIEQLLDSEIDFENPLDNDVVISNYSDVEKAAAKIRKKWKLSDLPIDDVSSLLEEKGIRIITFNRDTQSPGACGFLKNGTKSIPFIILNNNHDHVREVTRKRFTILHESAHLIFKFAESVDKELEERLCNRFASAFLLPTESLYNYLGKNRTNISIEELKGLKEKYGISVLSIIYRARQTGLIDRETCDRWESLYDSWYSRGEEFGTYNKSKEEPGRFNRLVTRGYMEKRISKEKASELLNVSIEELGRRFKSNLSMF